MTKQDLIEMLVHGTNGASKATVGKVLDGLGEIVRKELAVPGGEITLPGIGKLSVKESAARKGRNPATGEEIDIAAKRKPHFTAAKVLKDAVAK